MSLTSAASPEVFRLVVHCALIHLFTVQFIAFISPVIADGQSAGAVSCAMRGIIAAPDGTCLSELARNHSKRSHKTIQCGARSCSRAYGTTATGPRVR